MTLAAGLTHVPQRYAPVHRRAVDSRTNIFRMLLLGLIGGRLLFGAAFLNLFIAYSGQTTGPTWQRFHPTTFLIAPVLLFFVAKPRPLAQVKVPALAFSLAALALLGALAFGAQNDATICLDTLGIAIAVSMMLRNETLRVRQFFAFIVVYTVLANLPVVILETVLHRNFIPASFTEGTFRPRGLLDHPLTVGYSCLFAMVGTRYLPIRTVTANLFSLALLVELTLCSVRLPFVVGSALFAYQFYQSGRAGSVQRFAYPIIAAAVVPALLYVFLLAGWLDRLTTMGLFDDQSANARFVAFDILGSLSRHELLVGVPKSTMDYLMRKNEIDAFENSFVRIAVGSGVVVAAAFHAAIIAVLWPALRSSLIYLVAFGATFAGSMVLSGKAPVLLIAVIVAALIEKRPQDRLALPTYRPA